MRIYIASPYTPGDIEENVQKQIRVWHQLTDEGHTAYAPLLLYYCDLYRRRPYNDYLNHCLSMLPFFAMLLRLPGVSKGADIELKIAKELDKFIFTPSDSVLSPADLELIRRVSEACQPTKYTPQEAAIHGLKFIEDARM